MRPRFILVCFAFALCLSASAEEGYGPLIANGLDEQLAIGADLFFSETFEGNGRTCATCHDVADNYTLRADLTTVDAEDPLMVGDPDHPAHVPELELCHQTNSAEDCQAIRQSGLILVNADQELQGPDGSRSYSMRSIPHVLSLETSLAAPAGGPADHTGWGGDGAPDDGSLRAFATGAVRQHFTLDTDRDEGDFREPEDDELDAMETFQRALGRTNSNLGIGALTLRDDNAVAGNALVIERCAACHANAGALRQGVNQNFNTVIEEIRMAECASGPGTPGRCADESASLVPGANFDGGFGLDDLSLDDGRWGDGEFNTPPLVEAADTGPFFHDNRATSLEAAIAFYRRPEFLASPACSQIPFPCGLGGLPALGPEVQISAALRTLNAGLNIAMASQRINAARLLLSTEPGTDPSVRKVLALAGEELQDARDVLTDPRQITVFADNGNHVSDARAELGGLLTNLDQLISGGATSLQLVGVLTSLIAVAEDHLSPQFYAEGETDRCAGVGVAPNQYHDCRWLYDLGQANILFDNRGVGPSIVADETELTWTPNPGGTATLTLTWRSAEWSNPLFDETVLTDISRRPAFGPIQFAGSATQLPSGEFERSYSTTIPCVASAKYRMDVTARVGGVTETDSDMAKAARYCIGF